MIKKRLIYLGYAVASAVIVSYYGGVIAYTLFYLAIALPILGLLYIAYVYFHLEFFQTTTKKVAVKGEVLPYKVKMINESLLSFVHVKLIFYEGQCEVDRSGSIKPQSLLPGEEIILDSSLVCFYRGEYPIGACEIEISDFLYLLKIRWAVEWPMKMTVLPNIVELEQLGFLPQLLDPKITGEYLRSDSDTRDNELRNYQSGDQIKAIHWKASARERKLLIRKNEPQVKGENCLIVDLSPTGEEDLEKLMVEDKIIEVALVVGNFMMTHTIAGTLYYGMEELKACILSELGAFGAFYESCGKLVFDGSEMTRSLEILLFEKRIKGNYILITHQLSEEVMALILDERMKENQFIILLIEKDDEALSEAVKTRLYARDILVYEIRCKDSIKKILEKSEGSL